MSGAADLKLLLDEAHARYNAPGFIPDDPVSIPHQFEARADIEIAGFLTALIAWGRRASILASARRLMALMEHAPHQFVMEADGAALARLDSFCHRTFNGTDARALVLALRHAYAEAGGLEAVFSAGIRPEDPTVFGGIVQARRQLTGAPGFPARTFKHLADPAAGSSAKRINMFLRWMVRSDRRGVDFGLWKQIRPDQLICPLDVHTGTVARGMGLLQRRQNDWQAALELTEALRAFCPEDPVRYDFSLFGLGVSGAWQDL
ncbi:MAG: TIGR02757 family protein [Bacteroidia bacterium]|nr:TIGR02757 family protein [Bacteroidia bacterium]